MDKPIQLKIERLLLRHFTMDDVDDVLEYTNDAEWARLQVNIAPFPYTKKVVKDLEKMFSDTAN